MQNKKVIITGVTGQDGSYMAEYLIRNTGYQIIGAVRRTSQPITSNLKGVINNPQFSLAHLDLCDVHSVTSLIQNERPDYFINFGAQSFVADSWVQPALTMRANTESLIHICEAVRNFVPRCRIYSAGSSEQWGNVAYTPQDIKHPMRPRSIYGVSKCAASMVCKIYRESFGIFVVHGILCNHESERRQEYFVTRKITKGLARIKLQILQDLKPEPIPLGNLDAQRDWSHSLDFVDGIWKMLNQECPKEYVLASGETHSVREFLEKACACANMHGFFKGSSNKVEEKFWIDKVDGRTIKPVLAVEIDPRFYRPAEVDLLLGDSTPARKELGWEPKINFDNLVSMMMFNDLRLMEV